MTGRHSTQDSAGRWRDAKGRFAAPTPVPPRPRDEFRIEVFGEGRTPWRRSRDAAMDDAVRAGLASWDASERKHYLAVPVDLARRSV